MAIKGYTNQRNSLTGHENGKLPRLGFIQKGERLPKDPSKPAFGTNARLVDRDYFVFKPMGGMEELGRIFAGVYGSQPTAIPDVRLPHAIAGNFNIEQSAWLTASKHTAKGSVFLGRSDGEFIRQMRNPDTGKVEFFDDTEAHRNFRKHWDYSQVVDKKGRDGEFGSLVYKGKPYQWDRSMMIDLVLPAFNTAVFESGLAGEGVVTLLLRAKYDIPTIIDEYRGMVNKVASLFANPLQDGSIDRAKSHLPLRDIPIRLFRREDKITTPDWRGDADADGVGRLNGTRNLVHWQIAPEFAQAMQRSLDQRMQETLALVGSRSYLAPMLVEGGNGSLAVPAMLPAPNRSLAGINDDLFGDSPNTSAPPDEEFDWEAAVEAVEAVEVVPTLSTVADWAKFAWETVEGVQYVFTGQGKLTDWYTYTIGDYKAGDAMPAILALEKCCQVRGDGGSWADATASAKAMFKSNQDEEE